MAKKRQPIDDLIGAHVRLRREALHEMAKRNSGAVVITRDGVEYRGGYTIFWDTITVTLGNKQKTTHVSGSAEIPEGLARVLLSELVNDHLARPKTGGTPFVENPR